ncbi:hypothetical protein E1287_20055 [Actinomadura sp. KC06]|uniref:hypothetical protein n=1 Tax=Actinomadura sp. KC06 TaxID=2530369 RepID=UPI001042DDD3|nr:hypothetical protein [Actinomadura sp. KC06]TDD33238.1 hypothetical protein E1287_20055 [Actinomadura sp. KC06]
MTTGDDSPADAPISLSKTRPPEQARAAGPAWIVIPARVVALIVLVPLRLVHDVVVLIARGVRAVWNGVGRLLDLLIVRPLRWLAVVVILGFLRWLGRGTGRVARWIYRRLIAPVGRFFALIGRGLAWLLELLFLKPLKLLGRGLAWLVSLLGEGLVLLFKGIGLLIGVLVIMPLALLWRYVLRPPLAGLAWLALAVWRGLAWLGRGTLSVLGVLGGLLAAGWRAFAAALAWSWRLTGRCLAWLARVLIVLPAQTLWRYVLAPIVAGFVGTWRLAARVLRWLWRTLVVAPTRVLIVAPARWVGTSVLRPIGRGVRETWRVTVREPVRAARRTMRDAGRDVRLQLRRTFRGH